MKIPINSNLDCIVDHKKDDCRHIVRRGIRVAQIWLDPVRAVYGHALDRRELAAALDVVESNRSALICAYLHNKDHGAD